MQIDIVVEKYAASFRSFISHVVVTTCAEIQAGKVKVNELRGRRVKIDDSACLLFDIIYPYE